MPRRKGLTLTPAESAVVTDWQGWRRANRLGSVGDLAAQLDIDRSTLSRWSNGSRAMSTEAVRAVLRAMRTEAPQHLIRLDVTADADVRDEIRALRHLELSEAPVAGRGRAFAASL